MFLSCLSLPLVPMYYLPAVLIHRRECLPPSLIPHLYTPAQTGRISFLQNYPCLIRGDKNWISGCQGLGEGQGWGATANGCRGSFGGEENAPAVNGGKRHITLLVPRKI